MTLAVHPRSMLRSVPVLLCLAIGCDGGEPPPSPASGAPKARAEAPAEKPNVVVITMDTTRADALGVYGQKYPTSPAIDRMASQGVLFEQCASSAPSTLPSHASIFTGKQPYAHGARSNGGYVLSKQNVTLAEVLNEHGYRSAAEVATGVIDVRTQLDQGFEQYRGPSAPDVELKEVQIREGDRLRTVPQNDRTGADITRRGIEFLRANRSRPFFLWLHYFDPHSPYAAPSAFNTRIPESPYHAEVAYTDYQIGRVLEELTRLGLKQRTLVVLTADHGEGLHDHGEYTHTFFVYETTMRVPLIFWGPDSISKNKRIASLVRTVDIAPTVIDFLGLPPLADVQGTSLMPLLTGQQQDLHVTAYGESMEFSAAFGGKALRFVREGNWKYIHKLDPALYDLANDPDESTNLAQREVARTARLRGRLQALLEQAPAKPADGTQELNAETRAELIALGYVGADAPNDAQLAIESLDVGSFDPVAKTDDVARFAAARGRLRQGQPEAAIEDFQILWKNNPQSVPVLVGLVQTLLQLERDKQGISLIARASELAPDNAALFIDLARMARRAGRIAEAISALSRAVEVDPCVPTPRATLAELLRLESRDSERVELLRAGVEACPDTPGFRNDLAWALATSRDDTLRDGAAAVELAEAAVAASPGDIGFLDTLAAAYAEAGDFAAALRTAARVLELLEQRGVAEQAQALFRAHLASFESGQALRDE